MLLENLLEKVEPIEADLLLVVPPFQRRIVSIENVGIEYIAAYARSRGFRVRILNAGLHGLTLDQVVPIVERGRFRLLGISTLHWTFQAGIRIALAARRAHPSCHIILGGLEAALTAGQTLARFPFIDSVCRGEGERVVTRLLKALSGGSDWRRIEGLSFRSGDSVIANPSCNLIDALDDLPFPARDDMAPVLDAGGPVAISTSRGCHGSCNFCSVRAFYDLSAGPRWRGRTPGSVVGEIQHIQKTYGASLFSFIDETVAGPGLKGLDRLQEIASLILNKGIKIEFFISLRADQVDSDVLTHLKEAGLRKVELGLESMADTQLQRYRKGCQVEDNLRALAVLDDLGIQCEPLMIPFDSEIMAPELQENLAFYKKRFSGDRVRYDVAPLTMSHYLYPYPGTRTQKRYERLGMLGPNHYQPFQAIDTRFAAIRDVLETFVAFVEAAFPMSYGGLGNLWTNSSALPQSVYDRICKISASFGTLLVEVAEWAFRFTERGQSPLGATVEAAAAHAHAFVSRAERLRGEVRRIIETHGTSGRASTMDIPFPNAFSRQLHQLGGLVKETHLRDLYDRPFSVSTALQVFLKEQDTRRWAGDCDTGRAAAQKS